MDPKTEITINHTITEHVETDSEYRVTAVFRYGEIGRKVIDEIVKDWKNRPLTQKEHQLTFEEALDKLCNRIRFDRHQHESKYPRDEIVDQYGGW